MTGKETKETLISAIQNHFPNSVEDLWTEYFVFQIETSASFLI